MLLAAISITVLQCLRIQALYPKNKLCSYSVPIHQCIHDLKKALHIHSDVNYIRHEFRSVYLSSWVSEFPKRPCHNWPYFPVTLIVSSDWIISHNWQSHSSSHKIRLSSGVIIAHLYAQSALPQGQENRKCTPKGPFFTRAASILSLTGKSVILILTFTKLPLTDFHSSLAFLVLHGKLHSWISAVVARGI
jgi:hypothetical protein